MRKILIHIVVVIFIVSSIDISSVQSGEIVVPIIPSPGTLVHLSPAFTPAHLKGMMIDPNNAFQFDFLIDHGDGDLNMIEKNQEYTKLVKYFLAALTVPDRDQWVNLSPFEHNRIVAESFGKTEMGRDLLAQDYLLKQITSSLMYPETGIGKTFWDRVYARTQEQFGNATIPLNTFNKVWITPDKAIIAQSGNAAYIQYSHLKVMLEEDYLAVSKNSNLFSSKPIAGSSQNVSSQIIREIIIPELEREVNEGKNFAQLRQVFSGMILATWYKKALKETLLGQVYVNKSKIKGVDLKQSRRDQQLSSKEDTMGVDQLYQHYLQALKKGAYNYIKEIELPDGNLVPRKYFAGGVVNNISHIAEFENITSQAMMAAVHQKSSLDAAQVRLKTYREDIHNADQAMTTDLNFDETIAYYAMKNNDVADILRELFSIATRELMAEDGDVTLSGFEFEETYAQYEFIIRDVTLSGFDMPLLTKDIIHSKILALYENSLHYVNSAMTSLNEERFLKSMDVLVVRQNQAEEIIERIRKINDELHETRRLLGLANEKFLILLMKPIDEREHKELQLEVVRLESKKLSLTDEKIGLQAALAKLGFERRGADRAMQGKEEIIQNLDIIDRIPEIKHLLNRYKMDLYTLRGVIRQELNKQTSHTLSVQDKKKAGEAYWRLTAVFDTIEAKRNALQAEFIRLAGEEQRGKPRLRKMPELNVQQTEEGLTHGGIDMNAENLDLIVNHDENGVPLPYTENNFNTASMAQLYKTEGLVPRIINIRPAASLSVMNK